ncbi:MAG TPA: hypothetical protein VGD75_13960, partial [Bradyrhizobium sp.]
GFGTGALCAADGTTMHSTDAAISSATPVCMPRFAKGFVIGNFGSLFNESSRQAHGHFIVVSVKAGIVFL